MIGRATVAALAGVCLAATAASGATLGRGPASLAGKPHARTVTCRGPAQLAGFFKLGKGRMIKARKARCPVARKLAVGFSRKCEDAYLGQGSCTLRVRGRRWSCKSRIVGSFWHGAPSKETCRAKKARTVFVVKLSLPAEPSDVSRLTAAPASTPYDEDKVCLHTDKPGALLVPPAGAKFEIHLFGGTPPPKAQALQASLLAHNVSQILHAGLGSEPRSKPNRIWIFITPGAFDKEGNLGIAVPTCEKPNVDALIVRGDKPGGEVASTAAHELFHAYAFWAIARGQVDVPWWEEASATWSEAKAGFPEVTLYDIALQYPDVALDTTKGTYKYGMSRFVQFLDDKGLIGGASWLLQRAVILGYKNPGPTTKLAAELAKRRGPKALGELLAEFWGDRLKVRPAHGPRLRPAGANSRQVEVKPGRKVIEVQAESLHTELTDFKLSPRVDRVSFEFESGQGYFWGLVDADNDVRKFESGDSVSFCVAGADQDDLAWVGHFPVTFTNGNLSIGEIKGKITVRAQSDPEQCTAPGARNRACRVLRRARVKQVLGEGKFPFASESGGTRVHHWLCFFAGSEGEARLDLARHESPTKEVRRTVKRIIAQLDLEPIDIGDVAGIGAISGGGQVTGVLAMAVGREIVLLMVGPGPKRAQVITLGKRIAGELD